MSSEFMFRYLPSFYREFMIDENGNNILAPLFELYSNIIGDSLSQAQQLSNIPYLEKCPIVIKEYFKIINLNASNYLGNNKYIIDSDIIGFSDLYLDSSFTIKANFTFSINNDNSIRSIVFDSPIDPIYNKFYAIYCYKDKNILRETFGHLLNYQPTPFTFKEYGTDYINEQEDYRKQLLGILYCNIHGQTLDSITKSLSLFLGLQYAPFNAIVRDNSGTMITLEDIDTGNIKTINGNIKSSLIIGSIINKYDILENDIFKIYDIYSDPARFTQYILANKSSNLLNLLNIDISNNEKYAWLSYDSLIAADGTELYWDMGNNSGVDTTAPSGATNYSYPTLLTVLNNFSNYNDSRFNSQKIYEMFRNIFIIQMVNNTSSETLTEITTFLNRFKPIYTKFLLFNAPS